MLRIAERKPVKRSKTLFLILLSILPSLQMNLIFAKSDARLYNTNNPLSQFSFPQILGNGAEDSVYNITLYITDSAEETPLTGLNVTVYKNGTLVSSGFSDESGHVTFELYNGTYNVLVLNGKRIVGRREITVINSETFTVTCWAYELNITCIDQEGNPLEDHTVFLYDLMIFYTSNNFTIRTNGTGKLVNWTKTNDEGKAFFKDIWNGTYLIRVTGGEIVGEWSIDVQESSSHVLICDKADLRLRLISESGEELPNATVYVYNSLGYLIFKDHTDHTGTIYYSGIRLDNYSVFVEYKGTQVWSGIVNVYGYRQLTLRCSVFKLTLLIVDSFGNPCPGAEVVLRKRMREVVRASRLKLKTNEAGYVSILLPSMDYEVSAFYGIYSGHAVIKLTKNAEETVVCNIGIGIWFATFVVSIPVAGLALLLELRKLKRPLEIRKYKNLLSRLDALYNEGRVEYKLYRKLREEYEEKLIKLGRQIK